MRKRLWAVLLLLCVVVVFGYSGGQTEGGVQTVPFWSNEADPNSQEMYRTFVSEFQAANPNIKVDFQALGGETTKKALNAIATGAEVGVFTPDVETVTRLDAEGLLLPLNDVVRRLGGADRYFYKSHLINAKNQIIAVPYSQGGQVHWIRTDVFAQKGLAVPDPKKGWTWDECLSAASKASVDSNSDGTIDIYGIGLPASKQLVTDYWMFETMWTNGQAFFDKDLNVVCDTPYTAQALEYYDKLLDYAPPGKIEWGWYDVVDAFANGTTAIGYYEGRILGRIYRNNPGMRGKFAAAPLAYNKDFRKVTFASPDFNVCYAGVKYPEAAKKWVEFIQADEQLARFATTVPGHLVPPTKKAKDMLMSMDVVEIKENPGVIDVLTGTFEYVWNPWTDAGGLDRAKKQVNKTNVINPYYYLVTAKNYPATAVQKVHLENQDPVAVTKWMSDSLKKDVEEAKAKAKQ